MNYVSTLGVTAITMLVSIFATPLLLRWLGQERLGAYRATSDWAGYIGLLEMGLSGALPPMFAAAISRRNHLQTRQVMAVGLRAYRWVTLIMFVAGAAFVAALPYLVRVSPELSRDLRISGLVACGVSFFTPLLPLRPFLEGAQRGYIVNAALLVQSLVITALCLVFAWRELGLTGQWLAVACGTAIYHGIIFFCVWHQIAGLPQLIFGLNTTVASPLETPAEVVTPVDETLAVQAQTEVAQQLWKLNGPTLALNLCSRVSYLTDNIVIACFLGPKAVIPFFLTQRLAQIVQGQVQSIGNSTWAALAELHATGHHELFARRTVQLTQLVFVTGLAGMMPFLAFNRSFVIRWVGIGQYAGFHLMLLAVANGLLLSLFSFWTWLFVGTQNIRLIIAPAIIGGAINLAASIIAAKLLGVTGPLWGTFISFLTVYIWWMPLLMRRTFAVEPKELLGCLIRPGLLGLGYGAILIWIGQKFPPHVWILIALAMILGGLGYFGLASILVLDASQRQTLKERFLKRFLPRSSSSSVA